MLGLRHFHNHAIDLFLGDPAQFRCDGIVALGDSQTNGWRDELAAQLSAQLSAGHRHVALVVGEDAAGRGVEERAREVMAIIRDGLSAIGPAASTWAGHRITVVVAAPGEQGGASHDAYQDALFATFADCD